MVAIDKKKGKKIYLYVYRIIMKWTQKIDRDQRREKCLKQDIPIISKDTEQFLREYIAEHKPHSIIEI
jgi:hypothetical protein